MYNSSYQSSFGQQQGFGQQQSFGQQVQSQYRGLQKTFQPTGNVQSFYQPQQQTMSFGSQAQPQQYHTANYQGNQPGHDASLRADSTSASNWSVQQQYAQPKAGFTAFRPQSAMSNTMFQPTGSQGMNQYHMQNYVGNQPGHDASLRENSFQASSFPAGRMQSAASMQSGYGMNMQSGQSFQQQQPQATAGFNAYRNI